MAWYEITIFQTIFFVFYIMFVFYFNKNVILTNFFWKFCIENRLQEKATNLEKRIDDNKKVADQNDVLQKQLELEIKTKAVEDQFNEKCSDLDKKCDEVRQRSLKGNLIVSSPARTTSGGHTIPSLVKHEMFWDRYGNWRCETGWAEDRYLGEW